MLQINRPVIKVKTTLLVAVCRNNRIRPKYLDRQACLFVTYNLLEARIRGQN